jgi:hypothetical protein
MAIAATWIRAAFFIASADAGVTGAGATVFTFARSSGVRSASVRIDSIFHVPASSFISSISSSSMPDGKAISNAAPFPREVHIFQLAPSGVPARTSIS